MAEEYLGDGLYVSFDGQQIKLRAPRDDGDHVVYLATSHAIMPNARRHSWPLRCPAPSTSCWRPSLCISLASRKSASPRNTRTRPMTDAPDPDPNVRLREHNQGIIACLSDHAPEPPETCEDPEGWRRGFASAQAAIAHEDKQRSPV
jgi:hypothetical protein